jgi:hypothetical protein
LLILNIYGIVLISIFTGSLIANGIKIYQRKSCSPDPIIEELKIR